MNTTYESAGGVEVSLDRSDDMKSNLYLKVDYVTTGWSEENIFMAGQDDLRCLANKVNDVIDNWTNEIRARQYVKKTVEVEVLVPLNDDLKGISEYFLQVELDRRSAEGLEEIHKAIDLGEIS